MRQNRWDTALVLCKPKPLPILVFVIHRDHQLTIEMVETESDAQKKLANLKERACRGRNRREFKSPLELRAEIIHALSDLKQREMSSVSPMDAIRSEKERLEQLDPRFSVQIEATAESKTIHVIPRQPVVEGLTLKFLKKPEEAELGAYYEKGQSFRVKATDVEAAGSPILTDILHEMGAAEIAIDYGARFKGCLHIVPHPESSAPLIQIDGEWLLARKLISFKGQLSESPLKVELSCEPNEDGKWENYVFFFTLNWGAWERQPLLSLAYFNAINDFVRCKEFTLRAYIRGNEFWKDVRFSPDAQASRRAIDSVEWFQKCRRLREMLKSESNAAGIRSEALFLTKTHILPAVHSLQKAIQLQKRSFARRIVIRGADAFKLVVKYCCAPNPLKVAELASLAVQGTLDFSQYCDEIAKLNNENAISYLAKLPEHFARPDNL